MIAAQRLDDFNQSKTSQRSNINPISPAIAKPMNGAAMTVAKIIRSVFSGYIDLSLDLFYALTQGMHELIST